MPSSSTFGESSNAVQETQRRTTPTYSFMDIHGKNTQPNRSLPAPNISHAYNSSAKRPRFTQGMLTF